MWSQLRVHAVAGAGAERLALQLPREKLKLGAIPERAKEGGAATQELVAPGNPPLALQLALCDWSLSRNVTGPKKRGSQRAKGLCCLCSCYCLVVFIVHV